VIQGFLIKLTLYSLNLFPLEEMGTCIHLDQLTHYVKDCCYFSLGESPGLRKSF